MFGDPAGMDATPTLPSLLSTSLFWGLCLAALAWMAGFGWSVVLLAYVLGGQAGLLAVATTGLSLRRAFARR